MSSRRLSAATNRRRISTPPTPISTPPTPISTPPTHPMATPPPIASFPVWALAVLCMGPLLASTGCSDETREGSKRKPTPSRGEKGASPRAGKKDSPKDATPDPGFVRCAGLPHPSHPKGPLNLAGLQFQRRGYTLKARGGPGDARPSETPLCFGVVAGARHEKGASTAALERAAHELSQKKCRAILALGNMGSTTEALLEVYQTLARSKLPLLVLPGATEHMKAYTKALVLAGLDGIAILDLAKVRVIQWPHLTLVSVPGHQRHQALGAGWWACGFTPGDIDALGSHLRSHARAQPPPPPLFLVSHASPLLDALGPSGFDLGYGGAHGGSRALTKLAAALQIRFTVSAQIAEAGPAAVDPLAPPGEAPSLPPGRLTRRLWLHPGAMAKPLPAAVTPKPPPGPPKKNQGAQKTGHAAVLCFQKKGPNLLARYEHLPLH